MLLSSSPLHSFLQKTILLRSHQIWYLSYHFRSFLNPFLSTLLLYRYQRSKDRHVVLCDSTPKTSASVPEAPASSTVVSYGLPIACKKGSHLVYVPLKTPFQTMFPYIVLLLLYMPNTYKHAICHLMVGKMQRMRCLIYIKSDLRAYKEAHSGL